MLHIPPTKVVYSSPNPQTKQNQEPHKRAYLTLSTPNPPLVSAPSDLRLLPSGIALKVDSSSASCKHQLKTHLFQSFRLIPTPPPDLLLNSFFFISLSEISY